MEGALLIGILMFAILLFFIFSGHPVAFIFGGLATIFALILWPQALNIFIHKIYSSMNNYVLLAITLFVFMGNLLSCSGIADGLFESLQNLIGHKRGSLGVIVISICILFAACTGVVGASVVTMGLLSGPVLLKYGYKKSLTAGIIGAGGSLGILIPPSVMLVVMASQTNTVSVGKLFAAAIIPGLILGFSYIAYILVISRLHPEFTPTIPKEEIRKTPISTRVMNVVIYTMPPLLLIFSVLGSIFMGIATPTEASGIGSFVAFLMMVFYRKFNLRVFKNAIYETAKTTTMVCFMLATASCFAAVFQGIGAGEAMINFIIGLEIGKWGTLLLMMSILVILGCFIDWIAIVIITFPIFLPIAGNLGFNMVWFVTLIALVLQTSFITPPFGNALFYLFGLPLDISQKDVIKGNLPFVPIILIVTALVIIFPEMILWLPNFVR